MEASGSQRPTIVVVGAGVVCVAAMFLLAQTWDSLGSIGSAATQDSFREALRGHEMSVAELTDVVRAVRMIAGAAAVVCAVFALSAVTGRRDSRIALTGSATVVALAGLTVDPLLDAFLVFGAFLMIGSAPARAWYAGRALPTPGEGAGERTGEGSGERQQPRPGAHQAPLSAGQSPRAAIAVRPPAQPSGSSKPEMRARPTGRRPRTLLVALGALWLAIALGLVVIAGSLLAVLGDRAALVAWTRARFELDPMTVSAMQAAALVTVGLAVIGFALLLLAILGIAVFRGGAAARFLLLLATLAAAGAGFGVATSAHLASSAAAVVLAASSVAVVSVVLLMAPSVSEYFGDRPAPLPPAPAAPEPRDVTQPPADEQRFPPAW